jgi:hypothetical protein
MRYTEEKEGAIGLVVNYVFRRFSFQIGKTNQLGFSISYWDRDLDLEFLRWFLYINFSSKSWGVFEFMRVHRDLVDEYLANKPNEEGIEK